MPPFRYNHLEIMDLLLDRGADIDVRDSDGQTPLHHATRYAPKGTALNPIEVGPFGGILNRANTSGKLTKKYIPASRNKMRR